MKIVNEKEEIVNGIERSEKVKKQKREKKGKGKEKEEG